MNKFTLCKNCPTWLDLVPTNCCVLERDAILFIQVLCMDLKDFSKALGIFLEVISAQKHSQSHFTVLGPKLEASKVDEEKWHGHFISLSFRDVLHKTVS